MSQPPRITNRPTRLELEPLEAREVPAFGLDPTFGTGGLVLNPVGQVRFVSATAAVTTGDKLVTAGTLVGSGLYGAGGDVAVVRLTATGAADTQFSGDGLAIFSFATPHSVSAVAVLPDGKVLVAGSVGPLAGSVGPADATPDSDMYVLRLNADGSRDAGFGVNGEAQVDFGASDTLRRMVVQTDGKILLAGATATNIGTTIYPSATARLALARLTATGTADASFGTAGEVVGAAGDGVWSPGGLAVQTDGKVLVSGSANPRFGVVDPLRRTEVAVLRFTAAGTPDASFGTAGRAQTNYDASPFTYANDLAVLSDGRIVAGGGTTYFQGLLAWFSPGGTLLDEETFLGYSGGLGSVDTVIAMPQGGVEVAGYAGGTIGGTAVEYHAAPGAVADRRVLNAGPGYGLSGGVSLGAGGKLVVTEVAGGVPIFDGALPGGSLAVVRLAESGTTQSATTFVRWASRTDVPDGQAFLSATVLPLLGADAVTEGTITFREGSTVLGTLDLSVAPTPWGGPPAGVSLTLPAGEHTITAAFSGTARWAASSTPATFHVGQSVAVTATLDVSNTNPAFGEAVRLTAGLTAAGFGWPPGVGTVTFYDGATALGTSNVFAGGLAFLSTSALIGGTHSIRAVYSGGTGYDPATSAPVQVVVMQEITDVTLTVSTATAVVGQSVTFAATVSNPSTPGAAPGGTVTFYDGSAILGSKPVTPDGRAEYTTALRLGAHTVRAVYSGDANAVGPNVPQAVVTVGRAPTATTLVASAVSPAVGQPVTLTAYVRTVEGSAFPVGTVEFREGTRVLGSAALDGRGQAKLALTGLAAGPHAITAAYVGCSTCLGSDSAALAVTVGGTVATLTTLATSAPNPVYGQSQTLTARVSGATVPPAGRVEFYDGTTLLGSAALDGRGQASLAAVLNLGAHKLRAVYAGAPAFAPSSSTWLSETVTKAPTTIALTAGPGGAVRAQVRTAFAGSPIGTVTFKEGDVVLGTAAVNGSGVAAFAFGSLPPGKHRITAVYGGSSCFLDATSAPLNLTVAG